MRNSRRYPGVRSFLASRRKQRANSGTQVLRRFESVPVLRFRLLFLSFGCESCECRRSSLLPLQIIFKDALRIKCLSRSFLRSYSVFIGFHRSTILSLLPHCVIWIFACDKYKPICEVIHMLYTSCENTGIYPRHYHIMPAKTENFRAFRSNV